MIPVLYPPDTISCEVTEKRNGVFECLRKYPVSGPHCCAEEMISLETTGRLEKFDFSLMIRTPDRVEIMPTENCLSSFSPASASRYNI